MFVVFAARDKHTLPELGLACVTGSVLFVTPQVVGTIVSSDWPSGNVSIVYLRLVIVLASLGLALVLMTGHPREISLGEFLALLAVVIVDILAFWFWTRVYLRFARRALGDAQVEKIAARMRDLLRPVRRALENTLAFVEARDGFILLGGGLFLFGSTLQFVAGA